MNPSAEQYFRPCRHKPAPCLLIWGLLIWASLWSGVASSADPGQPVTVAVIAHPIQVSGYDSRNLANLFQQELVALTAGEFQLTFKNFVAQWNASDTHRQLNNALADPDVDLVLVMGFLANQLAVSRQSFAKPTFLPLIINGELLGAPVQGNQSGKQNLNYLVDSVPFRDDLRALQRVVPFKNFVLLGDQAILDELTHAGELLAQEAPNLNTTLVGHSPTDTNLVSKIPPATDAILLAGLPRLTDDKLTDLLSTLSAAGFPVFSQTNAEVEMGALASETTDTDIKRLARKTALNIQAVLLGEPASAQPIYFDGKRQLTINMATARTLGLALRFDVLSEATLLNEQLQEGPTLNLKRVAQMAIQQNLDLAIQSFEVDIGAQDVRNARAALLPQLSLSASTLTRDQSPNVEAGLLAERSEDLFLSLSQTLYSESQLSGLVQQRHLQQARQAAYQATRLDTIQIATIAYLEAVRATTQLSIQQDNLRLTRLNLDLARDRVRLGSASNADVYRWESNLADAQANVLSAASVKEQAREQLNRVLNRPLRAPFQLSPANAQDPFTMSEEEFRALVNNTQRYERFAQYHVDLGLILAPELQQLRSQLAATKRDVTARQRAHWLPDFSISGQYTDNLDTSGLGAGGPNEGLSDWNITLNATVPLVTGGARRANLSRARLQQRQLEMQIRNTEQQISQAIRANLHITQTSYTNIALSRTSARAARQNLEIISNAYRLGNKGIIDLLDAQNQSLQSELGVNAAIHNFLIDVMNLQRATGQFDFLLLPEEQSRLNEDVRNFVGQPNAGN